MLVCTFTEFFKTFCEGYAAGFATPIIGAVAYLMFIAKRNHRLRRQENDR